MVTGVIQEMGREQCIFMQKRWTLTPNRAAGNIALAPWPLVWPADDFEQ